MNYSLLQVLEISRLTGPIHKDAFCTLRRLNSLIIRHSNLSALPDLNCLKTTVFHIGLLNSGIRQFPPCYFNNWQRLQHLFLSGNELIEVPAIEDLSSNLYILVLAENNINTIYGSWANVNYKRLSFINLAHNNLTNFNFSDLAPLANRAKISLVGNQIAHLYKSMMDISYKIDLSWNPLVCDAKLAWAATSNLVIANGICLAPWCLQGVDVSRLSKYIDIGMFYQYQIPQLVLAYTMIL